MKLGCGTLLTLSLTAVDLLRPPEEDDISREKRILITTVHVYDGILGQVMG
jgi:hypothetical protein